MPTRLLPDSWTVLAPITNLELGKAVDFELNINQVTFVAAEKLPRRRRRFGISERLSEIRAHKCPAFGRFLGLSPTFAVIRFKGRITHRDREAVSVLRDELAILASSQLGYAKRTQAAAPAIWGERPTTRQSLLWLGKSKQKSQTNRKYGPLGPLRIDKDWLDFQESTFFMKLLKLLQGKGSIDKEWRKELRKAAIHIGLSQMSNSIPEAFLYNMIALELLLTCRQDAAGEALPSRAEALLGWSTNWTQGNFETKIQKAYGLRCKLVHKGNRHAPTPKDLYFTDDLLLSLLANLVTHSKIFSSKDDLTKFSERLQAARLLKVEKRIRPRSLRVFRRAYSARDYNIY